MDYEVFIPSLVPNGFDVTLVVEAENWMKALRQGLARTTKEDTPVRNVLCDIQGDNVIHVTDLDTRRVFKIREICESPKSDPPVEERPTAPETARAKGYTDPRQMPAISTNTVEASRPAEPTLMVGMPDGPADDGATDKVVAQPFAPALDEFPGVTSTAIIKATGKPLGIVAETGVYHNIGTCEVAVVSQEQAGQILSEVESPTGARIEVVAIGRDLEQEQAGVTDSSIEDVFLEISDLFEPEMQLESAVAFGIDLAMKHINADSGSVLFADETGQHLYFAAARGPKAADLLSTDFQVPIHAGIVGFCTRTGVSLAVADVPGDPRFYRDVAEAVGYAPQSIVAAPIQCEGQSFGVIELVNHKTRPSFNGAETNILTYIGTQVGRFIHNMIHNT